MREAVYGDPLLNIGGIGKTWATLINQHFMREAVSDLPASLVSLMMVAVKINRLAASIEHEDSHLDAHVYLKLALDLKERESR